MRKFLYRLVTVFMLIGGLIVLLYPRISNWIAKRNSTSAIYDYQESVSSLSEEQKEAEYTKALEYNNILSGNGVRDPFIPDSGIVLPEDYLSILNIKGIMGYLEIPKIDVNLPIYHGTGESVLKKGIGHLEATALPIGGMDNHTVLTGHRGLPSAKLLTDLDQIGIGDIFYLTVLEETIAYEVDQIITIEPNNTSELLPATGEDYVTLITCTPYSINTHRLLVRGRRTDYIPELREQPAEQHSPDTWMIWGVIASCLIVLAMVIKRKYSA